MGWIHVENEPHGNTPVEDEEGNEYAVHWLVHEDDPSQDHIGVENGGELDMCGVDPGTAVEIANRILLVAKWAKTKEAKTIFRALRKAGA